MVLPARERRTGGLQRTVFGLHQRRLLPRARAGDSRRGARAIRRRWPVLQHVRESLDRLQRCRDRSVPLRRLPDPLPRPLRPSGPGGRRRRLSGVHGRVVARGRRHDCRADSPQATGRRLSHLHPRPHRRHHVGVEHRGHAAAAALALFGQRQREPVARLRAGQAGDQSGDELHRLSLALRPRPTGRDRASSLPEPRPWRAARPRRLGSDGPAG